MTVDDAFRRINNLDVREALRKYSPQWATVVIDRSGNILDVIPHKEAPTLALNKQHMDRYPDSIQFTACPGQYSSSDALAARIKEDVRLVELAARPENVGKKWIKDDI